MSRKNSKQKGSRRSRLARPYILGIILILLPLIYYTPNYDKLSSKEIQVHSVGRTSGGRRSSTTYYIKTTDGDSLELRGEFDYSELKEKLQSGDVVEVKYYRGLYLFWMTDYVKEMTRNGEVLVAYSGDNLTQKMAVMTVIGSVFILLDIFLFNPKLLNLNNKNKKKKKKRDNKQNESKQ